MIQANELRIGNWVSVEKQGVRYNERIQSISAYSGKFNTFEDPHYERIETLEPISLTEEWLLKLGFKKQMAWTFYIPIIGNMKLVYYLGEKGWSIGNKEYSDHECKYVHQLQNLYFALTGEELTIKNEQP